MSLLPLSAVTQYGSRSLAILTFYGSQCSDIYLPESSLAFISFAVEAPSGTSPALWVDDFSGGFMWVTLEAKGGGGGLLSLCCDLPERPLGRLLLYASSWIRRLVYDVTLLEKQI